MAWNVSTRAARWKIPGRRGQNMVVPGQHGQVQSRNKPFDQNVLPLTMWAVGCNPDGSMPTDRDSRKKVLQHLDSLSMLFTSNERITLKQVRSDGTARVCVGEVAQAIDFSAMAGATRAEFAVEIVVPGAFWFDEVVTEQELPIPAAAMPSGTVMLFNLFAGATAPLVDARYRITGPMTYPILANPKTLQYVQGFKMSTGTLEWLEFQTDTWKVLNNGALAMDILVRSGGQRMFEAAMSSAGAQVSVAAASGFTGASKLKITGRKGYLLA